jgi:hypothetical protein
VRIGARGAEETTRIRQFHVPEIQVLIPERHSIGAHVPLPRDFSHYAPSASRLVSLARKINARSPTSRCRDTNPAPCRLTTTVRVSSENTHLSLSLPMIRMEYDICAIHGGLTRYCEECGLLTVWRRSPETLTPARRVSTRRKPEGGARDGGRVGDRGRDQGRGGGERKTEGPCDVGRCDGRNREARAGKSELLRMREDGGVRGMCIVKGKSPPWRKLRAWNVAVRSGIFAGMRSAG